MRRTWFLLMSVSLLWGWDSAQAQVGPDPKAKYQSIISKARDRLLTLNKTPGTGEAALAGYALIKAGLPKDHPYVQQLTTATVERINRGAYQSGPEPQHHVYEAACDAMLLADVDPIKYQPQLATLRDYLVRKQLPQGSWYYPSVPLDAGDTSITQFAILGLWAAKRAGLDLPQSTLDNAARWLLKTQIADGGFAYHPFSGGGPDPMKSTHTMTAAGCGSLLVIKQLSYPDSGSSETPAPTYRKRFGVLESLQSEQPKAPPPQRPTVREADLDAGIRKAKTWIADHYDTIPDARLQYCQYAIERIATLLDVDVIGTHQWYDEGARRLVQTQLASGEWAGGPTETVASTCFALLFLCRATQQLVIPPRARARLHGGGLLAGGKGLPDDLSQVDIRNGEVKRRVPKTPLDQLLSELERPAAEVNDASQAAVVEAVQLENRDQLIGQVDRLRKLVNDPRPEVRTIAVWALGRSDDLRQTPLLIAALQDPDLEVAAEAGIALCVLSRQPEGVRAAGGKGNLVPIEPPEPREQEDAASYAKRTQAWQTAARQAWHEWYLQVRPYDERDDRQEPRKK